jgi:hypothetical protein
MVQTQAQYSYVYKCVFEYMRRKEEERNRASTIIYQFENTREMEKK